MNKTKKIITVATFALLTLTLARFANNAAGYVPLVQIPGVPAGPVNLSSYIVGLYDFLLSAVGIVAVMMLIYGGIRYITAAGSTSAIGDAKSIMFNAIAGLLLALISWVIVSTINPDILYIQNPTTRLGSSMAGVQDVMCTLSNGPNCVCKDGSYPAAAATFDTCPAVCRAEGHCISYLDSVPCIAIGTSNVGVIGGDGVVQCSCIDGQTVPKGTSTCNDACAVANCYVADFRIGFINADDPKPRSYGFGPANDIRRAKDYAVHNTKFEIPLEATVKDTTMCDMTLAINAADYTVSPPGAPVPTYSLDMDLRGTVGDCDPDDGDDIITGSYPLTLTDGYFGSLACNLAPYACLDDETECETERGSRAIVCPMRISVSWGGGITRYATQFIKLYEP